MIISQFIEEVSHLENSDIQKMQKKVDNSSLKLTRGLVRFPLFYFAWVCGTWNCM